MSIRFSLELNLNAARIHHEIEGVCTHMLEEELLLLPVILNN
jgi:hypothetical protein